MLDGVCMHNEAPRSQAIFGQATSSHKKLTQVVSKMVALEAVLLAVALAASAPPAIARQHHKTVHLDGLGNVKANVLADGAVLEALAIPFAHPPLGEHRFRPAEPVRSWEHKGTLDGTQFGPACMQRGASYAIDEDCLTLNVWAPQPPKPDDGHPPAPLPVLVWAFGGGLVSGSGETFNGTNLTFAGTEPMIVVTMNYRVGAFGFYASQEIYDLHGCGPNNASTTGAMNGVSDILQALLFVQNHISAFGGDPTRVTLSGESSGSVASCALAFSPAAQGLFHQLILESGVCTGPWMGPSTTEEQFNTSALLAQDLQVSSLKEMQHVDAMDIVNADHFESPNFGVDGCFLTDDPVNLPLAMSGLPDTPRAVIVGGNSLDTTCVGATGDLGHPTDKETLCSHLETYFPGDVDTVLAPYEPYLDMVAAQREAPGNGSDPVPHDPWCNEFCSVWLTMSRDAGVSCPSLWIARQLSSFRPGSNTSTSVWLYQFGYNATVPGDSVHHGGELDFVWNRKAAFDSSQAQSVSAAMGEYWSNFVSTGKPSFKKSRHNWPDEWPQFRDAENEIFLNVSGADRFEGAEVDDASSYSGLFGSTCQAWEMYVRQGPTQAANFNAFGYLC